MPITLTRIFHDVKAFICKRLGVFIFSLCLFVFSCTPPETYRYENIQREYASRICKITSLPQETAGDETCGLKKPVSLTEALRIARNNNPDILMAVARIGQARSMIERSNASFYPTLGFYTEYMQGDAPSAYLFKTIDQRMLPPGTNFNYPGWFENWESGILAKLNLFNGGRDFLNKQMAETGLSISEYDRQSVENVLVASVIQTYYNALAAKEFIKTAEESVKTVDSQLRVMKVRYASGGALKSDILSLKVRLAQAQEAVVGRKNSLRITEAALAKLLGVNPDTVTIQPEAEMPPARLPEDYDAGLTYALGRRPELHKAREQLIRSRMAVDLSRSGYLPRVDFQTRYYMDDPNFNYDRDRDNWTAAVFFNWDLFTGFSTKADTKKAAAVLDEMLAADQKTVLSVKYEVKNAYLRLAEADERLKVARSAVDTAEESLNLVKKQYEGGSATITRYLEAELARNWANISAIAAFYDKEKAMAEIGRAIGYWYDAFEKDQDMETDNKNREKETP
ncbi:TolC family protein [Thermodesulfobacteriota bacterium]